MFRRVRDLVCRYLVGLVEPVDTKVAEHAKRLWLEEIPATRDKAGRPPEDERIESNSTFNNRTQNGMLAALKKKRPDLAQQVINGDISATKAARKVGARIVRSESRLKERAIYDL